MVNCIPNICSTHQESCALAVYLFFHIFYVLFPRDLSLRLIHFRCSLLFFPLLYELISGLYAIETAMERWQAHRTYEGESLALRPFNINKFVSAGIYWVVNAATATRRYLMTEGIQIPTHWTACVWMDKEVVASYVRVYVCHFLWCARKVHWISRAESVSVCVCGTYKRARMNKFRLRWSRCTRGRVSSFLCAASFLILQLHTISYGIEKRERQKLETREYFLVY